MSINFNNKVCSERPAQTKTGALGFAAESDRGRIMNSAAVRRLQQKTQVFPLERNAAVRSRLTHSLEVQQTGRFIVQSIFRHLKYHNLLQHYGLEELERPVESMVEMACLLHDVGNPPFGHSGESAINKWFAEFLPELSSQLRLAEQSAAQSLWQQLATELQQFEGNAQAIRLVHTLQQLNLTYTQVACILKYTRPATERKPDDNDPLRYLKKKPGYYFAEKTFIEQLQHALQMQPYCRHPLSYIMEAADDISYCLADIEDAVEKGIVDLPQLVTLLKDTFIRKEPENRSLKGLKDERVFADIIDSAFSKVNQDKTLINKDSEFFVRLRVGIIHPLVQHATRQFVENIDAIYHGTFNRALLEDHSQYHAVTKTLKEVAVKYVFSHREVELLELQGYRIIAGLLDVYKPLLLLSDSAFRQLLNEETKDFPMESRLLHKLSKKHLAAYQIATSRLPQDDTAIVLERYYRCRLLQDYISGMTDYFAADEYQTLVLCRSN